MRTARQDWFEGQLDLDPDTLVFLDETWTSTNMARRYGRVPRGRRCRVAVPYGHYKTTTVTAALRTRGLIATALLNGATNGQRFRAYIADTLVPVLKPGDTVIRDNLTAHKVAGVREAIEAAGARLLYLPAYSSRIVRLASVHAGAGAEGGREGGVPLAAALRARRIGWPPDPQPDPPPPDR